MRRVYELPYPPSVNHYWRHVGWRTLISREGRRYRREVVALLAASREPPLRGRLEAVVWLYPPDGHRRDLDNAMKCLLDSLGHAGVYGDDGQIDRLVIERGSIVPGGKVIVELKERP